MTDPVIVIDSDSDDDVQITNVVNIRRPRVVLHTPTGPMEIPGSNNHIESRSFEQQRPGFPNRVQPTVWDAQRFQQQQQQRPSQVIQRQRQMDLQQRQIEQQRQQQRLNQRNQQQILRNQAERPMRRYEAFRMVREMEARREYEERERRNRQRMEAYRQRQQYGNYIDLNAISPAEFQRMYGLHGESDEDYVEEDVRRAPPRQMQYPAPPMYPHAYGAVPFDYEQHLNDIPEHVLQAIERRDLEAWTRSQHTNLSKTETYAKLIEDKISKIRTPLTTTIDPEEDYSCPLCGVTLGVGIESDFKKSSKSLQELQEINGVPAPYQATPLITVTDIDLSKRIFFSKCGHTYCGRCVKNITSIKGILKQNKKKINKNDQSITNPFIYAPLKCVIDDCNSSFNIKNPFSEIYL